jgi:hypothetical protein
VRTGRGIRSVSLTSRLRLLASLASRPHRYVAVLAVGTAIAIAAASWQCNVYGPSLLLPAPPDAGTASSLAMVPPRTGKNDPSMTDSAILIVAMQSIDLGIGTPSHPIYDGSLPALGWNLDGVDTCPGAPSCNQAQGTKENCDDDAGRDHTGLELFRELGATAQTGLATANQALQSGQYGVVIEMTQYNGQLNDSQVSVAVYASSGVPDLDGGLANNGTDKWTIDPRYLNQGQSLIGEDCGNAQSLCTPVFTTDEAYVVSGTLVAPFQDLQITFGGRADIGGAVMDLSDAIIVAPLIPFDFPNGGSSWTVDGGTVAGRWGSAKLLGNMATIPDPTSDSGAFLCGSNDLAYQYLKTYICALQDITSNGNDNVGAPCDAISMAFGFTAGPAQLGIVTALPATPAGCDAGNIPFSDMCPL